MRRTLVIAALLLPGGCATREYAAYDTFSDSSLRGECERAVYDDPEVKAELARTAGSVNYAQAAWLQRLEKVKIAAVQRCMLKRGGNKGEGGVELPDR